MIAKFLIHSSDTVTFSDPEGNYGNWIPTTEEERQKLRQQKQDLEFYMYCVSLSMGIVSSQNGGFYISPLIQKTNVAMAKKGGKFTPRKDPRKGSVNRQPTGARERNVGHPNESEHSRVPKGNRAGVGIKRAEATMALVGTSVLIAVLIVDDATLVGTVDDVAIPALGTVWWESLIAIFA